MTDDSEGELLHGGACPVCGEEFGDGFESIEEGQQIDNVRVCVVEKNDDGEMADGIIHLPWEVDEDV